MAETVIAASLTLDSQPAETSVKSFRAQLKEATNDLIAIQQQFGETSDEAIAAAKNVAQLRAAIKDAKEVSDLFNPETKFQAFGNAVRASVGGITALTGAMALFGSESKEVQDALLKVQGALALTEGVNTLADSVKDFERLKVVALDAFNSIKVAIGTTGIGAIVLAVGTLVTYWDQIKLTLFGVNSELDKQIDLANKHYDIEKQKLDILTAQRNVYKEQGLSIQQIISKEKEQAEKVLANAQEALDKTQKKADEALKAAKQGDNENGLISFILWGKSDPKKVIDEWNETLNPLKKKVADAQNNIAGLNLESEANMTSFAQKISDLENAAIEARIRDQYVLAQTQLKNEYNAQIAAANQEYKSLDERNKVKTDLEKKYQAQALALQQEHQFQLAKETKAANDALTLAGITDETEAFLAKLKIDKENADIEAKFRIQNKTELNQKLHNIELQFRAQEEKFLNDSLKADIERWKQAEKDQSDVILSEIDKRNQQAKSKELQRGNNEMELNREIHDAQLSDEDLAYQNRFDNLNSWYNKMQETAEGNGDAQVKITQIYEKQKSKIEYDENLRRLVVIGDMLGQATQLLGEHTEAGKALAIAQATINTWVGATEVLKSPAAPFIEPWATVVRIAQMSLVIGSGLKAVSNIVNTGTPGVGSSSSMSGDLGFTPPSAPLQVTPQVGNTQLPQQQINQIGNSADPVRAFVVESDVSNSQERIARLNRAARLGG